MIHFYEMVRVGKPIEKKNRRFVVAYLLDHRKSKRIPEEHLFLLY